MTEPKFKIGDRVSGDGLSPDVLEPKKEPNLAPKKEQIVRSGFEPIHATLDERAKSYGRYVDHAHITQAIKAAMIDSKNWRTLPAHQKETLEMVAHKIGRVLNGDAGYLDSFRDCIGYLQLSLDIMASTEGATDAEVTRKVLIDGKWQSK